MAPVIQILKCAVAGKVPLTTELAQGQLAVNFPDKKLYTLDNTGAVIRIGVAPSDLAAVATVGTYASLTEIPTTFNPPVATTSVLGGVKQGTNIAIAGDGTISTVSGRVLLAVTTLSAASLTIVFDGVFTGSTYSSYDVEYSNFSALTPCPLGLQFRRSGAVLNTDTYSWVWTYSNSTENTSPVAQQGINGIQLMNTFGQGGGQGVDGVIRFNRFTATGGVFKSIRNDSVFNNGASPTFGMGVIYGGGVYGGDTNPIDGFQFFTDGVNEIQAGSAVRIYGNLAAL
jgi:hypothetical protein